MRGSLASAQEGRTTNKRVIVGVVLLLAAAVYFFFAPAFMISDGTKAILWGNIVPGLVLAILGVAALATGLSKRSGLG